MPNLQNIIAVMYDFDHTLAPQCMLEPLFKKYGIIGQEFWEENTRQVDDAKKRRINLDQECAYMNLMLKYIQKGRFPKLSNRELHELGNKIEFYPGIPDFFQKITRLIEQNPKYKPFEITLEHYVISTGLKEMVLGSAAGPFLKQVFASEFDEEYEGSGAISYIARAVGFIKKTEYIHLINKGINVDPTIDINGVLAPEERRIPFENMTYVGDGFTDMHCFATLNHRGGTSFGVYNLNLTHARKQAEILKEQNHVISIYPADYREGSSFFNALLEDVCDKVERIADRLGRK